MCVPTLLPWFSALRFNDKKCDGEKRNKKDHKVLTYYKTKQLSYFCYYFFFGVILWPCTLLHRRLITPVALKKILRPFTTPEACCAVQSQVCYSVFAFSCFAREAALEFHYLFVFKTFLFFDNVQNSPHSRGISKLKKLTRACCWSSGNCLL